MDLSKTTQGATKDGGEAAVGTRPGRTINSKHTVIITEIPSGTSTGHNVDIDDFRRVTRTVRTLGLPCSRSAQNMTQLQKVPQTVETNRGSDADYCLPARYGVVEDVLSKVTEMMKAMGFRGSLYTGKPKSTQLSRPMVENPKPRCDSALPPHVAHTSDPSHPARSQNKLQRNFQHASAAAYRKLQNAATSQSRSFQRFVKNLGDHDDLLSQGFKALQIILSHRTISNLIEVYSFLHIAYAMSQCHSTKEPRRSTPAQFKCGIGTFRACLSAIPPEVTDSSRDEQHAEQDIFDEIVEVMWEEIDFAIAWIEETTDWRFVTNMSRKLQDVEIAKAMLESATDLVASPELSRDLNKFCRADNHEPSFRRELREWGTIPGCQTSRSLHLTYSTDNYVEKPKDPGLEFHPGWYRRIAKDNPSGKVTWLNLVTGFVFLTVVEFLQEVQKTEEDFQYTTSLRAPYNFLCYGEAEDELKETDSCLLPIWQELKRMTYIKSLYVSIHEYVVKPLHDIAPRHLLFVPLRFVERGYIQTLRHFEDYVLGVRKIFNKLSQEDGFLFMSCFIWSCWACSDAMKASYPDTKRIKPKQSADYSWEYAENRLQSEYDADLTAPSSSNNQFFAFNAACDVPNISTEIPDSLIDAATLLEHDQNITPEATIAFDHEDTEMQDTDDSSSLEELGFSEEQSIPSMTPSSATSSSSVLPLRCGINSCDYETIFRSNLDRHKISIHPVGGTSQSFRCKVQGCKKVFKRQDNVWKHQRRKHSAGKRKK